MEISKEEFLQGANLAHMYGVLEIIKEHIIGESLKEYLTSLPKESRKYVHTILRIVLTGKISAPPNDQIMDIIGKEETLNRINDTMDKLDETYDFKSL